MMYKHIQNKQIKCEFCDKSFIGADYLKSHMVQHSDVKKFTCTVCDKNFHWSSNLISHLEVHNGVKSFNCKLCPKILKMPISKSHISQHSGKDPLICNICGKLVMGLIALKKHKGNIHKEENSFECTQCIKTFKQKRGLNMHVATIHMKDSTKPKGSSTCLICGDHLSF